MKAINGKLMNSNSFAFVLLGYFFVGLVLLNYYQFQINSDGIYYISIAQKYLNLDFSNAINGYWSPLISFLLVPFLYLGFDGIIAAKILFLIIGGLTIIGVKQLSYKYKMDETIRFIVILSLIPITLFYSLSIITPDLISVCLLIYYFNIIFDPKYSNYGSKGIKCGILGSLAFLSKSYLFYFFILHFIGMNLLHVLTGINNNDRKNIKTNFFSGILIFFIFSSIWISLLSNKYESFTISTAGKYNYALQNPSLEAELPFINQGVFFDFPNETAITFREDISNIEITSWSPFSSISHFKHQIKTILKNIYNLIFLLNKFSLLSIAILIGYLFLCFPIKGKIIDWYKLFTMFTMLLYIIGYTPFLIDDSIQAITTSRYFWILNFLLILMGGNIVFLISQSKLFNSMRKLVLMILLGLSFSALPIFQIIKNINTGKDIYLMSENIKNNYNVHGNIASNGWRPPSFLSYYLNLRFYVTNKYIGNISDRTWEEEIEKNNIDYFFLFEEEDFGFPIPPLSHYSEITKGTIKGVKIYSIK